jgi:hypothetical protein
MSPSSKLSCARRFQYCLNISRNSEDDDLKMRKLFGTGMDISVNISAGACVFDVAWTWTEF